MVKRLSFMILALLLVLVPVSHAQQDSPIQLRPLIVITHPGLSPRQVWRPDDQMVAISEDYGVRLYSATYEERSFIPYPDGFIEWDSVWSPDSRFLAIQFYSRETEAALVKCWQVAADGRSVVELYTITSSAASPILQWKPDSSALAIAGQVYSIQAGELVFEHKLIRQINSEQGLVTTGRDSVSAYAPLFWSPDGTRYASMSFVHYPDTYSYSIFGPGDRIIDLEQAISKHGWGFENMFWSADGHFVTNGYVVWDAQSGVLISGLEEAVYMGVTLGPPLAEPIGAWFHDGHYLWTVFMFTDSRMGSAVVQWDLLNGSIVSTAHIWHGLESLHWDEGTLIGHTRGGYQITIDPVTGAITSALSRVPLIPAVEMAWSPDSSRLVTAASGPTLYPMQLWDITGIRAGERIEPVWTVNTNWWQYETETETHGFSRALSLTWDQNSALVTTSQDWGVWRFVQGIDRWNAVTGERLQSIYFVQGETTTLAPRAEISPDLNRLAEFHPFEVQNQIDVLYPVTHEILLTFEAGEFGPWVADWNSTSSLLAACGDAQIIVWDVVAEYQINTGAMPCGMHIAWSPDSQWVASAGGLFNSFTSEVVQAVNDSDLLSWSPDSRRIVFVKYEQQGDDTTELVVYDINIREELLRMVLPQPANDVAWSPDGSMIAVCYQDGSIQIWRVDQ